MKTKKHEKKPQPWAKCADCHKFYDDSHINKCCGNMIGNKRCNSLIMSELRGGLWAECNDCKATGKISGGSCPYCLGEGWHYMDQERLNW